MGVHKPTSTTDRTISFPLQPGVEVYGGFAGTEDDLSERDWQANLTVLSGDIDGNDLADPTGVVTDTANINGANSYHVVTSGSGITESASLDGFVVTAGLANGASPDHRGGGIHNLGGDPTLVNLILSGNQADSYGGGMYSEGLSNNGSSPTLTGVAFRGNSGGSGGGLANIYYSSPILNGVTFEKNSAVSDGGGLYNREESNPTLTDCLFSENTAAAGAGMYNDIWTDPFMKDVVFDSNHASGSGGGLVAFNSSYPVLDGVTFIKNTALYGGGMWSYYNVQASIKNTRFIENSATDGGGLYSKETPYHTQQIVNTVFFSNTATRYGGAIYLFRSGIDLINSTLSKNSAEVRAGALYNDYQSGPYLKNSIFWDDQSPSAPEIYNDNSTNVISFSLVAGSGGSGLGWDSSLGTDGGGNLDSDPNFRDPDNGDLRLLLTSPAIDAGDNSLVPVGVTSDLDGNPRFVDILSVADTGSGTSPIVDLGAYEAFIKVHFAAPAAVGSGDCSTWSDACDLQTALASAVSGDQIWVQMGVHKPTSTTDRTISFALQHGVEVYGGFSGTEADLSEREWQSNLTVLSGDLDRNDLADPTGVVTVSTNIVGDNSYHVVTAGSGITESARLDGFVITAGDAHGAAPHNLGGGMSNTNSSPTVANSLFSGNQAGEGGGMHNFQSSPTLLNVVFSGGKGCSYGCGMANAQSSPLLNRVVFRNNASSYGGAMGSGSNSSPTLINVLFASNSAAENGGAMDNSTGTSPTLINVTFSDNNAGRYGGAIYNYYCTLLTMTNVVMWGNPDLSYYEISSINSPVVATYSLIKYPGGYPGTGNLNTNPLFADANGPDDIFGTTDDDLRLLPGSPAIDAGDNSLVPVEITTDLDGNLRFADDPDTVDTGSGTPPIVDMGAYEAAFSDIELEKEVFPGTVEPGDPITFTLSFTSTGGISAVQVVLTDTIPASVQVSSVISSGVTILDSVHTPAYVWDVQDMAPGAHGVITITGVLHAPLAAGEYSNMASISFGTGAFRADRSDDASWTVPNVAPYFSSTPLTSAAQDELYSYSIAAADGNGDSVAITAPTLPGWLSLTDNGDGTASLSGTPGSSDVGDHVVELEVEDSEGLKGTQGFTIAVANLNDPPEFTSAPVESADEDVLYTYNITASDPDLVHGDTLVITAATLPGWLTLVDNGDGTATLSGTPDAVDVGDNPVELEVEDSAGLTDTQSFTIVVEAAPLKEIYLPVIRR